MARDANRNRKEAADLSSFMSEAQIVQPGSTACDTAIGGVWEEAELCLSKGFFKFYNVKTVLFIFCSCCQLKDSGCR